jgi:hypothetical protein
MKSKPQAARPHQISDNRLPEDVLRQFIADLKGPIDIVEKSLPYLRKPATLRGEEILSRLGQAVQSVNGSIQFVIDYLHLKLKDGLIESDRKIAFEILGRFGHVLRESSAPLQGFVNVVQHVKLTEDEFEHNKEAIKHYGTRLVKDFRLLDSNWRVWLETRKFDWEASGL